LSKILSFRPGKYDRLKIVIKIIHVKILNFYIILISEKTKYKNKKINKSPIDERSPETNTIKIETKKVE
jgi:hypothetical protein